MMSKVVSTRKAPEANPEIKSDQANAEDLRATVLTQYEEAVKKRQFEKAKHAMKGFLVVKVERDYSTPDDMFYGAEYVELMNGQQFLSEHYISIRTEYYLHGFKFEGTVYGWPHDLWNNRVEFNPCNATWKRNNKMFERMETPLQIKTLDGSIFDLPNWAQAPRNNGKRRSYRIMTDTLFSALYPQFEPDTYKLVIVMDDQDEEFDITRLSLANFDRLLYSDIPLEATLVYKDDEE